jgi:hypothetical protein
MRKIESGAGRGADGTLTPEDIWPVYAKWHEAVHMSQLVTSPYVQTAAWHLLGLTKVATLKNSAPSPGGLSWSELRDEYERAVRQLGAPAPDEITAWNIIETQAVVQGLTWLTGSDPKNLRLFAENLYCEVRSLPRYVRLLGHVADEIGEEEAFTLLPRLCFLALQSPDPAAVFMVLFNQLLAENSATDLAASSPEAFCHWSGADPHYLSRSLRERSPNIDNHPCMPLFRDYFDRFEAVPDMESRLELLLTPRGMGARRTFWPTFTVFADGHVQLERSSGFDIDEELKAVWIDMTAEAVTGLELLRDGPGGG